MTTKKKASTGKKLKVKRETLRNLEVKGKGSRVKGGLMCAASKPLSVAIQC